MKKKISVCLVLIVMVATTLLLCSCNANYWIDEFEDLGINSRELTDEEVEYLIKEIDNQLNFEMYKSEIKYALYCYSGSGASFKQCFIIKYDRKRNCESDYYSINTKLKDNSENNFFVKYGIKLVTYDSKYLAFGASSLVEQVL